MMMLGVLALVKVCFDSIVRILGFILVDFPNTMLVL